MDSSADTEKGIKKLQRSDKIFNWRRLARPDRSYSPAMIEEKSLNNLPPLHFVGQAHKNATPPPKFSKLDCLPQDSSRIKAIVRNSLFPEIRRKNTMRAPSVNDLLPAITKFNSTIEVFCNKCKKTSSIHNETHLEEFKIWGACSNCQTMQFPTPITSEFSDAITFQPIGEYCEFAPESKIGFWLEKNFWSSVSEYLSQNSQTNAFKVNYQRIKQHPRLESLLKSTGNRELIYFLPGDNYWGVSFNGIGFNRLGKILMEIRSQLN